MYVPSALRTFAFVAACLVCIGHSSRRLRQVTEPSGNFSVADQELKREGRMAHKLEGGSHEENQNAQSTVELEGSQSARQFGVSFLFKLAMLLLALNHTAATIDSNVHEEVNGTSTWRSDILIEDGISSTMKIGHSLADISELAGDDNPRIAKPLSVVQHWFKSWSRSWLNSWRESWGNNERRGGEALINSSVPRLVGSRQLPLAPVGSRWPRKVGTGSRWISSVHAVSHLLPWISLFFSKRHSVSLQNATLQSAVRTKLPSEQDTSAKSDSPRAAQGKSSQDVSEKVKGKSPKQNLSDTRQGADEEQEQKGSFAQKTQHKESAELAKAKRRMNQLEQDLTSLQIRLAKQKETEKQDATSLQSRLVREKEAEMQAMVESFQAREEQLIRDQAKMLEQINEGISRERKELEDHYKHLLQSRERQLQTMLEEKTRLLERKDADSQAMSSTFKTYEEKLSYVHQDLVQKVDSLQMQYEQVDRERNELEDHYMELRAHEKKVQSMLEEKTRLLEQKDAEKRAMAENFKEREEQLHSERQELLEKVNVWQIQYQRLNQELNQVEDDFKDLQSNESQLQYTLEKTSRLLEQKSNENQAMEDNFRVSKENWELERDDLLEKIKLWQLQYQNVNLERTQTVDQYQDLRTSASQLKSMLEEKTSLLEQRDSDYKAMSETFKEREKQLEYDREELRNLLQKREWQMQSMLEDKTRLLEQKDLENHQMSTSFQAREEQLEHEREELLEKIDFWQSQHQHVNQERHDLEDHYKVILKQKDAERQSAIESFQVLKEQLEGDQEELQERIRLWKINYQRINRERNEFESHNKHLQSNVSQLQYMLEERALLLMQKDAELEANAQSFKAREEQLEHEQKEQLEMINLWQIQYSHAQRERSKLEDLYKNNLEQRDAESKQMLERFQAREEKMERDREALLQKIALWKIHYQRINQERNKMKDSYEDLQSSESKFKSLLEEKTSLLTQRGAESQAMARDFKAREEQLQRDRAELLEKIELWQKQYQRVNQERNEIEAHYTDILRSKEGQLQSMIGGKPHSMQRDAKIFQDRVEQLEHDRKELSRKLELWKMHYQRVNKERNKIEGQYKDLLAWREGQVQSMVQGSDEDKARTWAAIDQGMKSLAAVETKWKRLGQNSKK